MRLLVATRSPDKSAEIRAILAGLARWTITDLDEEGLVEEPAEDDLEPYDTFEANAVSKARWFARRSGLPTVADDSGLMVDALGGAPGVRTKRFAPEPADLPRDQANNRYLLERLAGRPPQDRGARYVCVAAFAGAAEGEPITFRGEVTGRILTQPAGQGGFGYDPVFQVPELGCTFAQASPEQKHALSHRGRAFRQLRAYLEGLGPG